LQPFIFESHIISNKELPMIFHYTILENQNMHANWHENIELLYFIEGSGIITCDMEQCEVYAGMIFVVNSNCLHSIEAKGMLKYYCIIIDSEFCKLNGINTYNYTYKNIIFNSYATNICKKIITEYNQQKPYYITALRSLTLELLVCITRNYTVKTVNLGSTSDTVLNSIKLAMGYINVNIFRKITLAEIATQVGLSKFYFSRGFKKQTGITVITYINILKCEKAKMLLSKGDFTVKEVCEQLGFDNLSYFSKIFKKYVGISPHSYIKNNMQKLL